MASWLGDLGFPLCKEELFNLLRIPVPLGARYCQGEESAKEETLTLGQIHLPKSLLQPCFRAFTREEPLPSTQLLEATQAGFLSKTHTSWSFLKNGPFPRPV